MVENADDGWTNLDQACKQATDFDAGQIYLPLLAAHLDPHGEADYEEKGVHSALAELLGSAGDANTRAAAAALVAGLEQRGYVIEHRPSRLVYKVFCEPTPGADAEILRVAVSMVRGVRSIRPHLLDDEQRVYLVVADGPTRPLLQALCLLKGVRKVERHL